MSSDHPNDNKQLYAGGVPTARAITPGGHALDTSQPAFPVYHRKLGNPGPLGLLGFAGTTLLLSFINVRARSVDNPQVVLGMAATFGGLAQFIAGVMEWAVGNTFGATAFMSYGAFWGAYAIIIYQPAVVLASYDVASERQSALGFFLATWMIFTFIMLLASLRSSVALVTLFTSLLITFILLTAGEFTASLNTTKAGGAFGILTAAIAYYAAASSLLTPDNTIFTLPAGDLSRHD